MAFTLASVVPLYHQIYLILREEFVERFTPREPLPTEFELMARFKVSRVTMRRAMDLLVKEGVIYRRRGQGSFVRERTSMPGKSQTPGLLDNIISMAAKTSIQVLGIETVTPSAAIATELALAAGQRVVKVRRLRSLAHNPVSHITTYVPEHLAACLQPGALSTTPMLRLLEESGVAVAKARQTISARLADTHLAALLETDVGAALLAVNRLVSDISGRPVQLLHGVYRPDRYEYRMELSRADEGEARVWYQDERPSH